MSIALGTSYSFTFHVENAAGTDADPTTVYFWLREHIDGTELQWTYNASPVSGTHYPAGMNPIVKDSTGDYSLVFVTRKPERHTGFWQGVGSVYYTYQQTLFVRHADVDAVDHPAV
jgi:hypothetical protein